MLTPRSRSGRIVEDEYETGFVEHAYIEPEAGFARRVGDRSKSRHAHNLLTWIAPISPRYSAFPPKAFVSFRQPLAVDLDRSSISPCSHSSRSRHGIWAAGKHGLFARRIDHAHNQAPSRAHARCAPARPKTANLSRSILPPTSTLELIPPGGRRSPRAFRYTPPVHISFRIIAR